MEGVSRTGEAFDGFVCWLSSSPRLAPLLQALGAISGTSVRGLNDVFDLLGQAPARGRLVLDGDSFSIEDVGCVRRLLEHQPQVTLSVVSVDAGSPIARALLALPRSRWVRWPPDWIELQELARDPTARTEIVRPAAAEAAAAQPGDVDVRLQVAALADISQRLALAFGALREAAHGKDAELEAPLGELRRLERFTRALSYRISPPARGDATFDVVALIEEELAAQTVRGRRGPRFLARGTQESRTLGELTARGDRTALQSAIQALLRLASSCSTNGDVVRVVYGPLGQAEFGLSLDFPAGPLAGSTAEEIFDSARLRERIPDYGINDLPAADAIVESHGGSLRVALADNATLAVQLRLPLERTTAQRQAVGSASASGRARGNDPFA